MKNTSRIGNRCSDLSKELRYGLENTLKYILSHHSSDEYSKCFFIAGRYVCARCLGIYLGIAAGAAMYYLNIFSRFHFVIISFFPAFMLMDWFMTKIGVTKSSNAIRACTGFMCGQAYTLAFIMFLRDFPNIPVLIVWIAYVAASLAGIAYTRKYFH